MSMDELKNNLTELSSKASILKNQITNEESTKTSLILPFFRMLGYDIENPQIISPEYTVGTDKVDYSIMQNSMPLLFIEAKNVKENLNKHVDQAKKYFNNSDVKIICLTNGLIYNFYSDMNKDNEMDNDPFLSLNIEKITDYEIQYLKQLSIDNFTMENYNDIIYHIKITEFIRHQLENPSEEFVRFVTNNISSRRKTKKFLDRLRKLIFKSMENVLNIISGSSTIVFNPEGCKSKASNSQIVTTEEELEGYKIIVSILSKVFSIDNLSFKDTTSYFSIIADKKPGQWIARLCLGTKKKSILLPDGSRNGCRYYLNSIEDLYKYEDEILESASKYLAVKSDSTSTINGPVSSTDSNEEVVEIEIIEPENKRPWWKRR
jgi:hypothetical protein